MPYIGGAHRSPKKNHKQKTLTSNPLQGAGVPAVGPPPPSKANAATAALAPAAFGAMTTKPPKHAADKFSEREVKWLRALFLPSGVGVVVRRAGGVGYGAHPDAQEDNDVPPDVPSRMVLLHPDVISRFMHHGSVGIGEAYMEQQWEPSPPTPDGLKQVLVQLSLFYEDLERRSKTWATVGLYFRSAVSNRAVTKSAALHSLHYDLGNDLYEAMLDAPFMSYTCAYWLNQSSGHGTNAETAKLPTTQTLDEAQENKLALLAQKLNLYKPGLRVLDIGCGFGGLAKLLATRFGAHVVGITLSKEQAAHAAAQMPHPKVTYRVQDYRHIEATGERFDRIVSVGMFEHVGPKNYHTFMANTAAILKPDGHMVLHFIGNNGTALQGRADPWIDKYIFPGAVLPTLTEFTRLSRNHFFVDDLQCIGPSYAKTLRAWHDNFHAALDDGRLHAAYADPTFVRMWDYYLLVCEALFQCRAINLWQFVLVPRPQPLPCGRPAHTAGQADYARVLPACIAATNRVVTIDGSPVNDAEEDEEGK